VDRLQATPSYGGPGLASADVVFDVPAAERGVVRLDGHRVTQLTATAIESAARTATALPPDAGAEDVDVLLRAGRGLRRANSVCEVASEAHAWRRCGWGVVDEHYLGPMPLSAERAFLVGAPIRVVATEGAGADQQGTNVADQLVHHGVGPRVLSHPRLISPWTGDEAIQRHRR
jgi:hypothetical protein